MKVVHISTYDTGGAAIAAFRLHQGLIQKGIDSTFLSLFTTFEAANKFSYFGPFQSKNVFEKIQQIINPPYVGRHQRNLKLLASKPITYEAFSFPVTDFCIEEHALVKVADIIHLHWVGNFINFPTFFKKVRKPLIWTLHDMNPFQGGFHYEQDKMRNQHSLGKLEHKLVGIKKVSLKSKKITIVTPSKWLGIAAKYSDMFEEANYVHIPYGLPLCIFKPHEKYCTRQIFDLPLEKKIILFVSDNINTYRKGFDLLMEAINQLNDLPNLFFITIGKVSDTVFSNSYVRHFGLIQDEKQMSALLSCVDLFVLPSREDNLPNVMLESIASGTPVLSFKIGGMNDCIKEGVNGFFAEELSAASLSRSIKSFYNGEHLFNIQKIREYAEKEFSLEKQANSYIKQYELVL